MFTYEQLIPILATVASKYAKFLDFKYEIDELINEVWSQGKIQNLPDIRLTWKGVEYGIMNYIQQQEGYRHQPSLKREFLSKLSYLEDNDDSEFQLVRDDSLIGLDISESAIYILKKYCKNRRERKIMWMSIKGIEQADIAKKFKCTRQNISLILKKIRARIKKDKVFMAEYFGKVA